MPRSPLFVDRGKGRRPPGPGGRALPPGPRIRVVERQLEIDVLPGVLEQRRRQSALSGPRPPAPTRAASSRRSSSETEIVRVLVCDGFRSFAGQTVRSGAPRPRSVSPELSTSTVNSRRIRSPSSSSGPVVVDADRYTPRRGLRSPRAVSRPGDRLGALGEVLPRGSPRGGAEADHPDVVDLVLVQQRLDQDPEHS